jgi:hypothetical protein
MIRTLSCILALALVAALAAPAFAGPSVAGIMPAESIFDGLNWLLNFLTQIQQQINQLFGWTQMLLNPMDALREKIAPILDRVYGVQTLATRIQAIIASLPAQLQWTFGDLVKRLLALRAPTPGTAEDILAKTIKADSSGPVAQRAQALDDLLESNVKALAEARASAETAKDLSKQMAEDSGPKTLAEAQVNAAKEIFERAQTTPSTRSAMQLLIEAFAAQMDQTARWNMHALGREGAMIQSQALLATQLSTVVDRLATSIDLQNAQQKQQLLTQVHGAYATIASTAATYTDMLAVVTDINSESTAQRRQKLFDSLRRK